jgi:hypothetical protein
MEKRYNKTLTHKGYNYQSNFGLVIASKSEVIATNKGKIYSIEFHESLYQSEIYGMLAAAVSLHHIIVAYKIKLPSQKNIYFYCYNKSVGKTINNRLEVRSTGNQHQSPYVHIEQQLIYELRKLNDKNCIINM